MKGLSCLFSLDNNGKFKLTDGKTKARDNLLFTCSANKVRVYEPYFGVKVLSLLRSLTQKPLSTLQRAQAIIKAQVSEAILEYNTNIQINDIDIGYIQGNRRYYGLSINYSVIEKGGNKITETIFV